MLSSLASSFLSLVCRWRRKSGCRIASEQRAALCSRRTLRVSDDCAPRFFAHVADPICVGSFELFKPEVHFWNSVLTVRRLVVVALLATLGSSRPLMFALVSFVDFPRD